MRSEVDDWFKHIFNTGPIKTKFDLYYFCLMAGLCKGKMVRLQNGQEFIDNFVSDYKPSQRLIMGLFLIAEMSRLGIELNDKEEVRNLINKYFDPSTPSHLKIEGFSALNDYANAGYIYLFENYPEPPRRVEDFIQWYVKNISSEILTSEIWSQYSYA
jgi:hypothetical protein